MKRKLLIAGLLLTLSVNMVGCQSTTAENSSKQSTTTAEPSQTESPVVGKPEESSEPSAPASSTPVAPTAGQPDNSSTKEPVNPSATNTEVTAPKEPQAPAKPGLPTGSISIEEGATVPEFVLPDLNGNKVSASSIINKHELTLINFWATT